MSRITSHCSHEFSRIPAVNFGLTEWCDITFIPDHVVRLRRFRYSDWVHCQNSRTSKTGQEEAKPRPCLVRSRWCFALDTTFSKTRIKRTGHVFLHVLCKVASCPEGLGPAAKWSLHTEDEIISGTICLQRLPRDLSMPRKECPALTHTHSLSVFTVVGSWKAHGTLPHVGVHSHGVRDRAQSTNAN